MPRTITEWTMALLFIAGLIYISLNELWLAGILIASATALGIFSFREVPASPEPSVAIPTFLGERQPQIIREGWVFACPGIENLIVENYLPEELTLSFDEVPCLLPTEDGEKISGGSVTVDVSLVYTPDITDVERLKMFLNNGGRAKISKIVEGMLGENIRHQGSTMTWEELKFAKISLSAQLISDLTGMTPSGTDDAAIKAFLQAALIGGVADIRDLGISIKRLNVVEVEPEGELKKNAEKAAGELLQRTAEKIEVDTNVTLAEQLVKAAGGPEKLSFNDAYKLVQIDKGHRTATSVESSGNPILDAAAVFQNKPPPGTSNS